MGGLAFKMPGITSRDIKSGKMSKIAVARVKANKRMVEMALHDEVEAGTCEFGRVVRHLGNGRIKIVCSDKAEYHAVIRGLLRKRGVTPITVDDVVILGKRDWESRAVATSESAVAGKSACFDVMGVLGKKEAEKMCADGRIPSWMIGKVHSSEDDDGGFEFEAPAEKEEEDDVDLDRI